MKNFLELFQSRKPIIAKISIDEESKEELERITKDVMDVLHHGYDGLIFENNLETSHFLVRVVSSISRSKPYIVIGLSLPKFKSERLFETASTLGLKFVVLNEDGYNYVDKVNKLNRDYKLPILGRISQKGDIEHNISNNINCTSTLLINNDLGDIRTFKSKIVENFPVAYEENIKNLSENINKIIDADCIIANVSSNKKYEDSHISNSPKLLKLVDKVNSNSNK